MKGTSRIFVLGVSAVLTSLAAGCSSGGHAIASRSTAASRPSAANSPTDASHHIYLAQLSCWDTESCCILRDPLTAAERCAATAERIAEVLRVVKLAHEATKPAAAKLKEDAQEQEEAKADESSEAEASEVEASGEPPNCDGQNHHIISRPIAEALEDHETLSGLYEPRDKRFVAKAKDRESHCGYQEWHRKVDKEVVNWLSRYEKATPEQFMKMLREIYNRPDMLKRFPNGF